MSPDHLRLQWKEKEEKTVLCDEVTTAVIFVKNDNVLTRMFSAMTALLPEDCAVLAGLTSLIQIKHRCDAFMLMKR